MENMYDREPAEDPPFDEEARWDPEKFARLRREAKQAEAAQRNGHLHPRRNPRRDWSGWYHAF